MTPKEQVEYLRNSLSKWEQVIEKLDDDDEFHEVIEKRLLEIKKKISKIIKKESPEDFLN